MATLVGAPPVTPQALQRALFDAQQRGGRGDYYGLGNVFKGIGDSYVNLNKQVQDANKTATSTAETDATLASGYYPAKAQYDTAYKQQQLLELQDVQNAVNLANQQPNLQKGTADYYKFIQEHVNTLHGQRTIAPELAASAKALQNQQMMKAYLTYGVKRTMAEEMARNMVAEYEKVNGPLDHKSPIWLQAVKAAVDNIEASGVNIQIDPILGTIKALGKDRDGNDTEINLDPKQLSVAAKIGGNPGFFDALQSVFNMGRQKAATDTATTLGASRAGLSDAQAAAGGKFVRGMGRVSDEGIKHLSDSLKAKRDIIKADPDMTTAEKLKAIDDIDNKLNALHVTTSQDLGAGPDEDMYTEIAKQRILQNNPGPTGMNQRGVGLVPGVDYGAPPASFNPYANVTMPPQIQQPVQVPDNLFGID